MRTNVRTVSHNKTHEGGAAACLTVKQELERTVMACMLWEDGFYESGQTIAARIQDLAHKVSLVELANMAVRARTEMRLRHVPLLLVREMARHAEIARSPGMVASTLERVIQRADEITEFLSIYWMDGKQPLSKQVKLGLARAFLKFNEYQLAKYNRDTPVKLRDALFLCHAKPDTNERADIWKRLVADELATPDTWEVALSGGADKHETFTRLLQDNKLGYMALLRNLRNMRDAGVDTGLIFSALLEGAAKSRALPFRYIAAARQVPEFDHVLDAAMQNSMRDMKRIPGKTVVLVDVSGSMNWNQAGRSNITTMDAGAALAALVAGVADDFEVYTFSNSVVKVPSRLGMGLIDAVITSQPHGGTYLGTAIQHINSTVNYDRLLVFTDEQSHDTVGGPANGRGYMVNVASNQRGVGYGPWVRINGFSEAVIDYIREYEEAQL